MPSSTDLLDANVWLALTAEAHSCHAQARAYWQDAAAETAGFCRITQLALLRHLTNKAIMGAHVLTPAAAWKKCGVLLTLPEVDFLTEPPGLSDQLGEFCNLGRTSPNLWIDAYLASFARCAALRLVTFDQGFTRFADVDCLVLETEG